MEQLSLFQATHDDCRITKPIRLIECFGGIGAQSKALEVLGIEKEEGRGHTYILTYSFPANSSFHPNYAEGEGQRLRIRKLTPFETGRLMGFQKRDTDALYERGMRDGAIYHFHGDSIVTTCLIAIFGKLLGKDPKAAIEGYVDELRRETL